MGTMEIRMYVINAFTARTRSNLRTGNPAAVALLDETQDRELSDEARQELAAEMNLSETAFITRVSDDDRTQNRFKIRWFTPKIEVDLCGHATLAAARAVLQEGWASDADIVFETVKKGTLRVSADEEELQMEFPALEERQETNESEKRMLREGLGVDVMESFRTEYDMVARVKDSRSVRDMTVDVEKLKELDTRGIIVTANGEDGVRFVSRFFAPRVGIGEDPVTGSAHCVLAPLFIDKGEEKVEARQLSERGGWLTIGRPRDGVVRIGGRTRVVWNGTVFL